MDPNERVTYVMGIITIVWIIFFDKIIEFYFFGSFKSRIPNFVFVIAALFLMWLYKYVYITKKRYEKYLKSNNHKFTISEKEGISISIVFVFLSFIVPMIVIIIFHKMNNRL
jgi:hypothetical protein